MSIKILTLQCPQPAREQLAAAMRLYAEAAYPPGGSECDQVARVALQDAAGGLVVAPQADAVQISRRMKPQVEAALKYLARQGNFSTRGQRLRELLSGTAITEQIWQRAEQDDAA